MPKSKMILRFLIKLTFRSFITTCVIMFLITSCRRAKLTKNFVEPEKRAISAKIVLHRTSHRTVTITDADGFGLVNGRVSSIAVRPHGRAVVLIEFVPFDTVNKSKLNIAEINIDTIKTKIISGISPEEYSLLKPIDECFPK